MLAWQGEASGHRNMREMLREALTDDSQMLLVGIPLYKNFAGQLL